MSRRHIWTFVAGALALALVAFLIAGLLFPDSVVGRLLQGAGVLREREPDTFPSPRIQAAATIPQGEGLGGGLEGTSVTFQGGWDGMCKIWGTDPGHPSGMEYYAGTFRMTVTGRDFQGYCIDLQHSIHTGDTYLANVYAATEPQLCAAYWILANYSRDAPGPGLSPKEEGAAIQAAIYHHVAGFQPLWDASRWCFKRAVFDRAVQIMNAAQGQCIPIPADLSLAAVAKELWVGQIAELTARVSNQSGQPLMGQTVSFGTTFGDLGTTIGTTDAAGQVAVSLAAGKPGSATVTARIEGLVVAAVVDPVDTPTQRVMIVRPVPYTDDDLLEITWSVLPGVLLDYFTAEVLDEQTVVLRWQTRSEVGNQGFNLYHSPSEKGPWIRLNQELIPSQAPAGGGLGAAYEWIHQGIDAKGDNFYLLETVGTAGIVAQQGPIKP